MKVFNFLHRQGERGVVLIETAASIALFFLIIGGSIDLSRAVHAELTMNYALNLAARWSVLGKSDTSPVPAPSNCASDDSGCWRASQVAAMARQTISTLGLDPQQLTVSVCPIVDGSTPLTWDCTTQGNYAGGSTEMVRIKGTYPIRMFFGGTQLQLASSLSVRNEPY